MHSSLIRAIITLTLGIMVTAGFAAETPRKCTIKQLVGSVKIRRGASAAWVDARPKMPLKETDALRTFIESEAELETGEGTVLKVGENTTVELSALRGSAQDQNTGVRILNGAILANVKKLASPASTFEFETPTATAAIRGTVVGLEVSKERTSVKVYEGKVLVTPQGSKNGIELQQYQMGVVEKGKEKVAVGKFDEKSPVPLSAVKNEPSQNPAPASDSAKTTAPGTGSPADSAGKTEDTSGQSMQVPGTTTPGAGIRTSPLVFAVSVPREGQEFSKPLIPVSGTATAGAEVTVMSMKLPVTSSGSFNGQVPIANESGAFTLEFEATLGGSSQKISRRVVYKPEYRFIVSSPSDRQTVTSTNIVIKGDVLPANAEVSVGGKRMSVSTAGQFSGYVTIPDEEGEVVLEFEIIAGGVSRTESRRITYKKPPDTNRPQVVASLAKGCWNITVFDRTADEEITLWYETDGNREFKTMLPNESTCLPLENGVHSYRVYAEDRSKNLSTVEQLTNHAYLSTNTWLIKMSRPAGNMVIDVPPSSPAGEEAVYPIEFSIENLPQDNMALIREVSVANKTSGRRVTLRTFTDNFIAAELDLVRGRINQIQIDVNDINNITKSRSVQINVQ